MGMGTMGAMGMILDALRNTWEFDFDSEAVKEAAQRKAQYHHSRQNYHQAQLEKVIAAKPLAIDPPPGMSGGSGYQAEDEQTARVRHHRGRIDWHKGRWEHFMRWHHLLDEFGDTTGPLKLTYLDAEHFGLGLAVEDYGD